ncbi:hypothetical protein [Photorhabdus cinerea]|uniref:Immunity protein n=1 Tax=Photorhabdus cinerea TaxID=471575 RepID=A0A7X5TIT4_9GAMM|nr:hypothetical protein [Photorhabdus cinerea]NHB93903.1 hypothetical protein [Photorhabdus cinerea]
MKLKDNTFRLFLFIIYFCSFLSLLIFTTRLIVALIFYFVDGNFYFYRDELWFSVKRGIATGVPLGIGAWFLARLKENKS